MVIFDSENIGLIARDAWDKAMKSPQNGRAVELADEKFPGDKRLMAKPVVVCVSQEKTCQVKVVTESDLSADNQHNSCFTIATANTINQSIRENVKHLITK